MAQAARGRSPVGSKKASRSANYKVESEAQSAHDTIPSRSRYFGAYLSDSAAKHVTEYKYAGRYPSHTSA